ncbi:NAD-dependent epimerase/dehydratase family protein [Dolichospermum circinale CS-1225]|uniref:NAD-dependent epimerase/dehydratase family protein n=1 Tax=Dolichospermum circinale TaxID=109265 RepID=UPI00232EC99C|nr:NAD-dependent epimerase/dehydratase family protein [Dolichospermum circinale]MDB9459829.1 NAD-dependent epimerase/dehydratase family protein [Dolichospermum circinale CS-545/17]MDB9522398.1 NAD-dependent epimerase/dehydratase family protein [Dolichospermum circinale CS-1225]
MKVLITGSSGFTGTHLVKYLQQNSEIEIDCVTRNKQQDNSGFICDLTDCNSVENLIQEIKPDRIYHLAGSFTNDYSVDYANNVISTKNILDSLIKSKISSRVLLIGSAAEYGLIKEEDNPVSENYPFNPASIYGLTKVYQTHLMQFYCQVHDMDIVMARTFNLLGKNISRQLFIGRVYQQIEEYKSGKIDKIILGDLESKRDYIDVQEAVKYYETIMVYGKTGEIYNVGSGNSVRLYDLLKSILLEYGLTIDIVETRLKNYANKINVNDIFSDLSKVNLLRQKE